MAEQASELIKRLRQSRRLTKAALADLAHVPASTIGRIESGVIEPTMAMVIRIAEAAGFRLEQSLTESGGDQPFVQVLDRYEKASDEEREQLFRRFPAVGSAAPVTRRSGMLRVELPGDLKTAFGRLSQQGQNPVVSSIEAVVGQMEPMNSFVPILYVDDPSKVHDFDRPGRRANQVFLLLPTTSGVRRFTRMCGGVLMVTREWGLLDAIASPGRQGEIARDLVDSMRPVTA
jgi:transcriptional regulator with XRE-family HTH domain